jgi:zinc/manganese transport system substrate-binding protein
MAVLVYNRQNATPDTEALKKKAVANGIPVVEITETLNPPDATFQAWQVQQLTALKHALAVGTGR